MQVARRRVVVKKGWEGRDEGGNQKMGVAGKDERESEGRVRDMGKR